MPCTPAPGRPSAFPWARPLACPSGVEFFFDGHGLGSGGLPFKDGTELGEFQVAGSLRDVAQKHDEQVFALGGLPEAFEVRRPRRETP